MTLCCVDMTELHSPEFLSWYISQWNRLQGFSLVRAGGQKGGCSCFVAYTHFLLLPPNTDIGAAVKGYPQCNESP